MNGGLGSGLPLPAMGDRWVKAMWAGAVDAVGHIDSSGFSGRVWPRSRCAIVLWTWWCSVRAQLVGGS